MAHSMNICTMCGGTLDVNMDAKTGTCQHCGGIIPISTGTDEKIGRLLNRANGYRMEREFDRATSLYEQALDEGSTDHTVYWGLTLCTYGIEYVKDPKTDKYIPKCKNF